MFISDEHIYICGIIYLTSAKAESKDNDFHWCYCLR